MAEGNQPPGKSVLMWFLLVLSIVAPIVGLASDALSVLVGLGLVES